MPRGPKNYDSTVARIAGNLLSGMRPWDQWAMGEAARWAVGIAREIVAETERTEPRPAVDAIDPHAPNTGKPPTRVPNSSSFSDGYSAAINDVGISKHKGQIHEPGDQG